MPNLLSTIDMARRTGWNDTPADRSALTRYLKLEEIQKWLGGAATHPKYPESSAPRFEQMLGWHRTGMTPKMMLMAAKTGSAAPAAAPAATGEADAEVIEPNFTETGVALAPTTFPVLAREMAHTDAEALVDRLAEKLGAVMSPASVDRFIGREEAANLLHCATGAVGRYVRAVRPGVWSHLDIQAHMLEARQKAHDKPARPKAKSRIPKSDISHTEMQNT